MCILGWHGTHTGLNIRDLPTSGSIVLGLNAWETTRLPFHVTNGIETESSSHEVTRSWLKWSSYNFVYACVLSSKSELLLGRDLCRQKIKMWIVIYSAVQSTENRKIKLLFREVISKLV